MSRVNLICWLVVIVLFICGSFYTKSVTDENKQLKTERQELILNLEKRNNDIMEISRKNKELEARVKEDTSGFDWHFDLHDNPVIKQLQKQCVSCPK